MPCEAGTACVVSKRATKRAASTGSLYGPSAKISNSGSSSRKSRSSSSTRSPPAVTAVSRVISRLAVAHPALDEERGVVDRDERVDVPAQRLVALDHHRRQLLPQRVSQDVQPAAQHEVAFVAQAVGAGCGRDELEACAWRRGRASPVRCSSTMLPRSSVDREPGRPRSTACSAVRSASRRFSDGCGQRRSARRSRPWTARRCSGRRPRTARSSATSVARVSPGLRSVRPTTSSSESDSQVASTTRGRSSVASVTEVASAPSASRTLSSASPPGIEGPF